MGSSAEHSPRPSQNTEGLGCYAVIDIGYDLILYRGLTMAIKKVFTCASCSADIVPRTWAAVQFRLNYLLNENICEGCFQDGVLDDININGDIGTVNTSEVY